MFLSFLSTGALGKDEVSGAQGRGQPGRGGTGSGALSGNPQGMELPSAKMFTNMAAET